MKHYEFLKGFDFEIHQRTNYIQLKRPNLLWLLKIDEILD